MGRKIFPIYSFHGFGYFHIFDDTLHDETFNQIFIGFVHVLQIIQCFLESFIKLLQKTLRSHQFIRGSMQYVLIYILFEEVDQFKSIIKLMLDISKDFLPKTQSKSQSNLVIATLNYCDIMNNPFQFYCAQFQKELEQLSQIFVNLIPTYFPSFNIEQFKWSMGKLDQKIRIGRYSPAFDGQVGIIDNRFISKEQFEQKWDTQFTKILSVKQVPFTQQQRVETRAYDFLIYHTLLVFVYGIRPFSELIVNNSQAYRQKYKPFYQLSFLSQQRKLNKTMTSFSNIAADLFFIQQYSQKFKDEIQKTGKYYTISDQTKDTLIIAKKQAFKVNYPPLCILSKLELSKLNWAGRTAIAVLDRYIIINAHLSSDKAKNRIQINEVKMGLLQIQRKHPHHYIIVGGDLNSFLTTDQIFGATFNTFPSEECQVTTVKKRTMIQAQFHKGNKLVAESKDKIISNLPLEKGSLRYINNEQTNNDTLIPSDSHPFDHYVVVVQLKKP